MVKIFCLYYDIKKTVFYYSLVLILVIFHALSYYLPYSPNVCYAHICGRHSFCRYTVFVLLFVSYMCHGIQCDIKGCRLIAPSPKDKSHLVFRDEMVATEIMRVPVPYLQVQVQTKIKTLGIRVTAVAHYFSEDAFCIESVPPVAISRGHGRRPSATPVYFEPNKPDILCFPVPMNVATYSKWNAIISIGDSNEVAVATYPTDVIRWKDYEFPEKSRALNPIRAITYADENPLIEYIHETKIESHPRITFFLRKPVNIESFSECRGLLALCLLSHNVEGVKRQLQEVSVKNDLVDVLRFAEDNGLAVLCWGSRSYWDPLRNWDEFARKQSKAIELVADGMADAWEKAVRSMVVRYGIPPGNYLLSGFSGAAQYALRLAMKKPQYFLAVHVHVPSSFPIPVEEARGLLLCLTTGEWESGYERSIRFLEAAQDIGIPIVYKAIPRLGHSVHPQAIRIGLACFRFALENPDSRTWKSAYKGDVYRQSVSPSSSNRVGDGIWVDLQDRRIAEAWL